MKKLIIFPILFIFLFSFNFRTFFFELFKMEATGGSVSIVNGYKIHTFTTSGEFIIKKNPKIIEYLIVGGGGGGASAGGGSGVV